MNLADHKNNFHAQILGIFILLLLQEDGYAHTIYMAPKWNTFTKKPIPVIRLIQAIARCSLQEAHYFANGIGALSLDNDQYYAMQALYKLLGSSVAEFVCDFSKGDTQ